MSRAPRNPFFASEQIFSRPPSAITVLGEALGISREEARLALQKVVASGYYIAPREPSNSMFHAYLTSYGMTAKTRGSIIVGIAKARKRWHAMGSAGTRLALSWRTVNEQGDG